MNGEFGSNRRWDDRTRLGGGFLAKTNPNRDTRPIDGSDPRENIRAEFSARTDPDYGRAPLTDGQKELATRYLPLAKALAKQLHARWHVERDEVESVAYVALVEAARCYDADGGAQFPTFARYRIVGAILDFSRKAGRSRHVQASIMVSWRGPESEAELYGTPVGITPDLPVGADVDAVDAVESHFRPMSPVQARACRLIYLEGKSQVEAAEIMECTISYISKIHREAIEFLFERIRGGRDLPPVAAEEARRRGSDAWHRAEPIRARTRMPKLRPLAAAC